LVEAVALDDTDVLKKGHHSVGVALQWVSRLKAVENCQVLVGLHLVGQTTSCPLRLRLYLPKEWADNPLRREEAGIPEGVHFEEKWRIGLRLLRQARRWGLRCRTVVADAAYGDVLRLRRRLRKLGYTYGLGIRSGQVFWAPRSGLTVDVPLPVETLAAALPKSSWRKVHWRDGTKGPLKGRFAALRVQAAPDWTKGKKPQAEEWLLIEWPEDAQQPVHYWLSNLPLSATLKQLVRLCTLRSRVELDYQQLKGELGLTHYEGRSWRGLHHHAAMCVLAYAFLALQRAFPPSTRRHPHPARRPAPAAERTAAATGLLPHLPQASL
jgi:SRSO17 transposase